MPTRVGTSGRQDVLVVRDRRGGGLRRFVPDAPGPSSRRYHPEQEMISPRGGTFIWPPAGTATATWPLTAAAVDADDEAAFPQYLHGSADGVVGDLVVGGEVAF